MTIMKSLFWLTIALSSAVLFALPNQYTATDNTLLFPQMPGVQIYTYRHSLEERGVVATLNMLKAIGFKEVEYELRLNTLPIEQLKTLLDERDLKVISVAVNYEDAVEAPELIAQKAMTLGASYVAVPGIPHNKDDFNIENTKKAVADFNRIGKVLSQHGLTFCYHPHGYEFKLYKNGTLFDYIAQNTDPDYVSFEMDTMWIAYAGQDPVNLLDKYSSRWKLLHLKDLKKGVKGDLSGKTADENSVALGTGQINIPAVLQTAQRVGIKYYFIEDESPYVAEQVPQSLEYLGRLKK